MAASALCVVILVTEKTNLVSLRNWITLMYLTSFEIGLWWLFWLLKPEILSILQQMLQDLALKNPLWRYSWINQFIEDMQYARRWDEL